eukprot:5118561-Prymnesium_polylepis.1
MIWEGNDWKVPFSRELAAAGVARLGDLHDGESSVMTWDARVWCGASRVLRRSLLQPKLWCLSRETRSFSS